MRWHREGEQSHNLQPIQKTNYNLSVLVLWRSGGGEKPIGDSREPVPVSECVAVWLTPPHLRLIGAVVFADVVDDARDAERAGEAQQVGQEAECDAEDERSAECFPQGLPDPLWALGS